MSSGIVPVSWFLDKSLFRPINIEKKRNLTGMSARSLKKGVFEDIQELNGKTVAKTLRNRPIQSVIGQKTIIESQKRNR